MTDETSATGGRRSPKPDSPASGPRSPAGQRRKVLVVEDNAMNRQVAEALLEEMGHEPVMAPSGFEALDVLSRIAFDVILMDIEMPDLNGMETTRRLRAGAAGNLNRRTPVLALTAHVTEEYRRGCVEAGMDGYLAKPVEYEVLRDALDRKGCAATPCDQAPEDPGGPALETVLDRFGGRGRILARVSRTARTVAQSQLSALHKALSEDNLPVARKAAHTLAGTFANFFMNRATRAAREAEQAALKGDADLARDLARPLAGHVGALLDFIIDNHLDGGDP